MNPGISAELIRKHTGTNVGLLKALANSKRLCILCALLDGEKTVSEIQDIVAEDLRLSQSSLSQHLGRMRDDRLVHCRRDSRNVYYSLRGKEVRMMLQCLHDICTSGQKNN